MVVSALLLVGTVYLFRIVPTGFIPSVDTGQLNGQIEAIQGIGFDAMVAHQKEVMAILAKDPNVASFTSNVGGQGGGRLNVDLKPRDERTLTADQIIEELRPKLARVPGVRVVLSNPPAIRIGGMHVAGAVSVLAAGSRHRGALSRRARLRGGAAQRARAARRQLGPADHEPGARASTSIASRLPRSA